MYANTVLTKRANTQYYAGKRNLLKYMQRNPTPGFSLITLLAALATVLAITGTGWYIWQKNREVYNNPTTQSDASQSQPLANETAKWAPVTTQNKAFSMRVPDGWKMTNYPNDFLGSMLVVYKSGELATIETSNTEYVGHSLRFRASVAELDDAGLGPQWASPQPGLDESVQDFSIGSLQGKRYKGGFSQDLDQTLYEYIFGLGSNKKLDIVYTVYHKEGEKDDVSTVEKAIKTTTFN